MENPIFQKFKWPDNTVELLFDHSEDKKLPVKVYAMSSNHQSFHMDVRYSYFLFCAQGAFRIYRADLNSSYDIHAGQYVSIGMESGSISPIDFSLGILIEIQYGATLFTIGGPIEPQGRVKYKSGKSKTFLIHHDTLSNKKPYLDHNHFPTLFKGISHLIEDYRIGLVIKGGGVFKTSKEEIDLNPGDLFLISSFEGKVKNVQDLKYSIDTENNTLDMIVFHPQDSETFDI